MKNGYHYILIGNIFEEKGMSRHRLAGICPRFSFYDTSKTIDVDTPPSNLNESTNDSTHHVAQETIGTDFKVPSGGRRLMPFGSHHLTDGGLNIGMSLAESAKVVIFHQHTGRLIHFVEVQRVMKLA